MSLSMPMRVPAELHKFKPRRFLDCAVGQGARSGHAAGGGGVAVDAARFELGYEIKRQREFPLHHCGGGSKLEDAGNQGGADLRDFRSRCFRWNLGERFICDRRTECFGLGALPG